MANVAELVVKIIADTKDAQKGVDDVARKAGGMSAPGYEGRRYPPPPR